MTDKDIADIIWVVVGVVATTSITNNIIGFHLNRVENKVLKLQEMMNEHTELLKRVANGGPKE